VVMDEVDRVFGRPYQDDFFALLGAGTIALHSSHCGRSSTWC
jgi:hypothetical protein